VTHGRWRFFDRHPVVPAAAPDGPCDGPVEVWYVVDGSRKPRFSPYYVARCECTWVGPTREGDEAEALATNDAVEHSPHVMVGIRRPLD
jgi:hypothetical protein